ncbi:hypothetical protein BSNK01_15670 [Bacillaceae bacterium]
MLRNIAPSFAGKSCFFSLIFLITLGLAACTPKNDGGFFEDRSPIRENFQIRATELDDMGKSLSRYKTLPKPVVTINGEKVPLIQGNPPPELLLKNVKPVVVAPGSQMRIQFKHQPLPETLYADEWHRGNTTRKKLDNLALTLPNERGVYVYTIYNKWSDLDEAMDSNTFVVQIK